RHGRRGARRSIGDWDRIAPDYAAGLFGQGGHQLAKWDRQPWHALRGDHCGKAALGHVVERASWRRVEAAMVGHLVEVDALQDFLRLGAVDPILPIAVLGISWEQEMLPLV